MGEVVDINDLGPKTTSKSTKPTKNIDLKVIQEASKLLKKGFSHEEISKTLHDLGFSYKQIDQILSEADLIKTKKKKFDYRIILLIVGLIAFAFFAWTTVFSFVPCENDFCTQEILSCSTGKYSSMGKHYEINNLGNTCEITITVISPSNPEETVRQKTVCTHPIVGGVTYLINKEERCV